jgi:hypothetical protein
LGKKIHRQDAKAGIGRPSAKIKKKKLGVLCAFAVKIPLWILARPGQENSYEHPEKEQLPEIQTG